MKIYIASDHAGFTLKQTLIPFIQNLDFRYEVVDLGPEKLNLDDDYPDTVLPVAEAIKNDNTAIGIIIGGSGEGEAMVANRISGVRAAVFYGEQIPLQYVDMTLKESKDPYEIVKLARSHNNANILSIGARFVGGAEAKMATKLFMETEFSGDDRHLRRINKIDKK